MRYIFWAASLAALIIFAAFLHYTLPQKDIVRIVDSDIKRMEVGERPLFWGRGDSFNKTGTIQTRDVRFINTVDADGKARNYRNEDTGIIGWPPYFKVDSSDLQTRAADLRSTVDDPIWVMVTHYGWRSTWFTIFPNAVSVKKVENPTDKPFPIFNTVVFVLLALLALGVFRLLQRFKARRIDPLADVLDEAWEDATRPNVPFGERIKSIFRRDR